jgi:hypothetical protein
MRLLVGTPAVLWWMLGALVAVALHLLARPRADARTWPSVRFLEATPLSLRRWARLRDPALLASRVAVVCLAALAFAGPVVVTPGREQAARRETARAVVSDGGGDRVDEERRGVVASEVFVRPSLRDAVDEAAQWLADQTAYRRELVVVSAFRRGRVGASTFQALGTDAGVRLVRISSDPPVRDRDLTVAVRVPVPVPGLGAAGPGRDGAGMNLPNDSEYSVQADTTDGGVQSDAEDDDPDAPWAVVAAPVLDPTGRWSRQLERWHFAPAHTERRLIGSTSMTPLPLSIETTTATGGASQEEGQAALFGEAAQGLRLPPSGLLAGTTYVWDGRPDALTSALEVAAALPLGQWEPEPVPDPELRALEREPTPEGIPDMSRLSDRRWFWMAVLLMLAAETWLRGRHE